MHYLLYLNIIPGGKHWWVTGIKKDGFAISDNAKDAKKYKHRATVYRASKQYGLSVLIVGKHPKYIVVNGNRYLNNIGWSKDKYRVVKMSKTVVTSYAKNLNAKIVACYDC